MKRILAGTLVAGLILADAMASGDIPRDTLSFNIDDTVITDFDKNLDALSELEYLVDSISAGTTEFIDIDSEQIKFSTIPDSVFISRLQQIPTVIDLSYNRIVRRYIEVYLTQRSDKVETMLGMADYYFPVFDDIFDYYDVPNEMKYMAIIESALNPRAVSRAGAVGLWQFMYGTGRYMGLTINSLVDERRDPIKSTQAAARYSKYLYDMYGDWLLVIAAYNCGPGNVNKAIRRSGGKKNYWEIYYNLPRETRGHVPAFIAATYVMNYYQEHGLLAREIHLPGVHDTIVVMGKLHLQQVSEVLDIPIELIRDMNPQYRADVIPASAKEQYTLRLPEIKIFEFIDREQEIFAYKDSVFFNPQSLLNSPAQASSQYYHVPPSGNNTKLVYTVKTGDNLGFIADWYKVGISDIRHWNNLRGNTIRSGQKLAIYKANNVADRYRDINSMSFTEKQASVGKAAPATTVARPQNNQASPAGSPDDYITYTVRQGDTLWDIARQFPGVSDKDIMQWNNLNQGSKIIPGQTLKIKKKS